MDKAFYKTLEATGNVQNDFAYDEYASTLKLAGLASASLSLWESDCYQRREGVDALSLQAELAGDNALLWQPERG